MSVRSSFRRVTIAAAAAALLAPAGMAVADGGAVPAPDTTSAVAKANAPKNVIVLIGDGMGYNAVDQASLYARGRATSQVEGAPGAVKAVEADKASFPMQRFPVRLAMSTYSVKGSYDPKVAWGPMQAALKDAPTDSAAAATSMATGVKTYDAAIGVDADKNPVINTFELAKLAGKATGVVSSVPFTHATPAAYVAHNPSRNDYHGLATEMIDSDTNVIIGAGHPKYDDDNKRVPANFKYLSEGDFGRVSDGDSDRTYVETAADFNRLARNGYVDGLPKEKGEEAGRLIGLPQVGSTLQQGRSGDDKNVKPYSVPRNSVPSLATLTKGALNVLDKDQDGFYLMVEGGAIDWAGHANQNTRSIEETLDFNAAVNATIRWVEQNSSWAETLVIVTADHETGYLTGPTSNPNWSAITGKRGELPNVGWLSTDHSNQLVPLYARGKGSYSLNKYATNTDPVRGKYLDNTDVAKAQFAFFTTK